MEYFVTADLHLDHANIIEYTHRPFRDVDQMNKTIIHNWNERIKKEDVVYHLGDFCFRGGKEGGLTKADWWASQLNGKIIHLKGNHDSNNGVKTIITHLMAEFADKVILMQHIPPMHPAEIPAFVDVVLCGHVHDLWKVRYIGDVPLINVGTDQWNFYPVKLIEIIVFLDSLERSSWSNK